MIWSWHPLAEKDKLQKKTNPCKMIKEEEMGEKDRKQGKRNVNTVKKEYLQRPG
jgi:hypothetical protein